MRSSHGPHCYPSTKPANSRNAIICPWLEKRNFMKSQAVFTKFTANNACIKTCVTAITQIVSNQRPSGEDRTGRKSLPSTKGWTAGRAEFTRFKSSQSRIGHTPRNTVRRGYDRTSFVAFGRRAIHAIIQQPTTRTCVIAGDRFFTARRFLIPPTNVLIQIVRASGGLPAWRSF